MSLVKFLAYVFRLFRKQENYHVIYPKSYDDILEVSYQHLKDVNLSVHFLIPTSLTPLRSFMFKTWCDQDNLQVLYLDKIMVLIMPQDGCV